MNKNKRIILSIVYALLLVTTSILGTIAYLTSEASVVNTFTVGQVNIALDETKVNEDGIPVDKEGNPVEKDPTTGKYLNAARTEENGGNAYHLIPGKNEIKDPTITIKEDSEQAYVRMVLTIQNASAVQAIVDNDVHGLNDFSDLLIGWDNTKWIYQGYKQEDYNSTNNTMTFEFRYHAPVIGGDEDIALEPLFTELRVPATLNSDEIESLYIENDEDATFKMIIVGHAIQAVGFTADEEKNLTAQDVAWLAFDEQKATNP